ncbi:MAG: chorismate mutase [Oscillospiraceae bacterium]
MEKIEELESLRRALDDIDRQLVAIFERRMALSAQIGAVKGEKGLPVLDEKRRDAVLRGCVAGLDDPSLTPYVETLYETILALSCRRQEELV